VDKVKTVALASMVVCIVLAASMVGIYLNLNASIQSQSEIINEQGDQIQELRSGIGNLTQETDELYRELDSMSATVYDLSNTVTNLTKEMEYFRLPD
jgi:methyl-accepting chemotaxis protein